MANWVKQGLFVAVTLTGLLLIFETILSLSVSILEIDLPDPTTEFLETSGRLTTFDSKLGWVLKSNQATDSLQTNSLGFRSSSEFDFSDPERVKILVLGDSMIYGSGVSLEDIFVEILNGRNSERLFFNTGVMGYSTWQEYLLLEDLVDEIEPDVVLLFYTQSNDMLTNIHSDNFYPSVSLRDGEIHRRDPARVRHRPLYRKTTLYRLVEWKILRGMDLGYLFHRLDFELREEDSYVWKATKGILGQFAALRDEGKFELIVIDIPTWNQLTGVIDSRARQRVLRQACDEFGFPYYDLEEYYPREFEHLFLDDTSHWNEAGHRFVADFVTEMLDSRR